MTLVKFDETDINFTHPICVNWNSYIRYEDSFKKNVIVGDLSKCPQGVCNFCNQNGYLIQCDYKFCEASFHVKCAVN